ncbi:MAG: hypothetical protein Kow00127_23410 [Bacteroidales bacterium]
MKALYKSKEVYIGSLPLGGSYPVRIQSMTTTGTMDTAATVRQVLSLAAAGCEMVRITAPGIREAKNLKIIRDELKKSGCNIPLIADIHYRPEAALEAARHVDKIRINPGNYVDRKKNRKSISDAAFAAEVDRIRERLRPVAEACREYKTAIRVGVNHGSLSERIILRYGDTPEGMVESAMEFITLLEELDFTDIVISMKASNVVVMVEANRLLAERMQQTGRNYPVHLGVTEAGNGLDGRVKSVTGIGTLLREGIGDTVRVSLTEPPEAEIPSAAMLASAANLIRNTGRTEFFEPAPADIKREKLYNFPVVVSDKKPQGSSEPVADLFFDPLTGNLVDTNDGNAYRPWFASSPERLSDEFKQEGARLIVIPVDRIKSHELFSNLLKESVKRYSGLPVILKYDFGHLEGEFLWTRAAWLLGAPLLAGWGDGLWLSSLKTGQNELSSLAFSILQATRRRISKTEFIACPGCGRTLFDLQETLEQVKKRMGHLKNLKIGVMGCCVNGPGEMADADYGYVGAGKGKVTLYKGKKVLEHNISQEEALDRLEFWIRKNNHWND